MPKLLGAVCHGLGIIQELIHIPGRIGGIDGRRLKTGIVQQRLIENHGVAVTGAGPPIQDPADSPVRQTVR